MKHVSRRSRRHDAACARSGARPCLPYVADGFNNASSACTRGEGSALTAVERGSAHRGRAPHGRAARRDRLHGERLGVEQPSRAPGVAASTDGTRRRRGERDRAPRCSRRRSISKRGHGASRSMPVQANGRIDPTNSAPRSATTSRFVSVMALNNETGVRAAARHPRRSGQGLPAARSSHVDAVQAPAKSRCTWTTGTRGLGEHRHTEVRRRAGRRGAVRAPPPRLRTARARADGRSAAASERPAIVAMGVAAASR